MIDLVLLSLTAYAITFVLVSSKLLEPIREFLKEQSPGFRFELVSAYGPEHFFDCRMCVGFWVCSILCLLTQQLPLLFPVYGLSYFLATQER